MNRKDLIFSSIVFCYFLDQGPCSIDFFFPDEIKENPDLTAVRLMTKSTALVKGDSTQQVEQSIIDQLSGPDIYPVDTKYRMVWYNWLIINQFSNDPRIRQYGAIAGLYCIYKKKNETIIRNSLKIIEKILRDVSSELNTIDDVIRRKFQLIPSTVVTQTDYIDFIQHKDSDVITKKISTDLNDMVKEYTHSRITTTEKFKIILQSMVLKKGTTDEIINQSEKKLYWISVINKLDQIIKDRIPNLVIKKTNENELREIYHLLVKERVWVDLALNERHPLVQDKDISDFFFYYWLAHHQLLQKKKVLQLYIDITS